MLKEKASKRKIKLKHLYLNGKMVEASRYTLCKRLVADVTSKISTNSTLVEYGAEGGVRTHAALRQQVLSLPPLTTRTPPLEQSY